MIADVLEPLEEYKNVFKQKFKDVCEQTYSSMATEAQVDVEANRETCKNLYSTQDLLESIKSRIGWWRFLYIVLWIGVVIGAIVLYQDFDYIAIWISVVVGVAMLAAVLLFFLKILPCVKKLKKDRDDAQLTIEKLQKEAWQQMEPLNRLYDWDIFSRMMSQTVPRLEFDPYFTTQRLADLKQVYGWDDSFNKERSVIYSHSGLINGNPFVLCRTRKMDWGSKTYTGSLTIHWTTTERDSNGRYYTRHHSEVLYASYTAPFPEYFEKTRLIYGNTAAPDLIFNRVKSGLAGKEGTLSYKWNRRKLRKKSEDLKNSDYAMMTNEEFEVAFDTHDRNNNQQYALLFTPLAQENMMAILSDNAVGYGDDFDFSKHRMINTIIPDHMQDLGLDMNPDQFRHFDFDKAATIFYTINANYFRAIYFALAPLLCVPMYQQIRPLHEIYGRDMMKRSAFWEHESLANCWGQSRFKHPDCVTDCIIKTEQKEHADGSSTIQVYAHGYRVVKRTIYIGKFGGDGRMHDVPVVWDEYLPVIGQGQIQMQEDNELESANNSQVEHLIHINEILNRNNMNFYRRHIASRVTK